MRTEPTAASGSRVALRFPARLPAGWGVHGQLAGYLVACSDSGRPRPTLFYTAAPAAGARSLDHLAGALCADLPHRYQDLLVLDVGPATCRGGRPGVRVLTTHTCAGRSLTTEHWFVEGSGDQVHVLAAVVPTARYGELAAILHRALRSFREPT
ncbi:MAG: hypothetical protein ABR608_14375 [Pseudonocardiaceae bacterium]